jgi:L-threonylcarbamoyladenylate synthase
MRISLAEAKKRLEQEEVIAVPTDTVYGIAADMKSATALDQIFVVKKRPDDKPLLILVADCKQIEPFATSFPPHFLELAARFWPGALTLVIPVIPGAILNNITKGSSSVGFRIPKHRLTLELLRQFGPFVASSANISGEPAPISAEEVESNFGEDFPVLDGGKCETGIASTILCYQQGGWTITREGGVSRQELQHFI